MSLGLERDSADEVAVELDENADLSEQIGTHPHIVELFKSSHTQTWFRFGASSSIIVTQKGWRRGCRFGSNICNLAYVKALKGSW